MEPHEVESELTAIPAGAKPVQPTHTPGPWKVVEADWNERGDARYVLEGVKHANAADAALIAAAPDLLEALKTLVEEYTSNVDVMRLGGFYTDPETEDVVIAARAAIAKAEPDAWRDPALDPSVVGFTERTAPVVTQPASSGSKRRVG